MTNLKLIASMIIMLAMSGCLVTRNELKESEGRRQTQDSTGSMQRSAAPAAPVPATDAANQRAELEGSIRELNGKIEVLENRLAQSEQGKAQGSKALEDRVNETNRRNQALQEELEKMQQQMQAMNEQMAAAQAAQAAKHAADSDAKDAKKDSFEIAEEHFAKKDWRKAILNYQKYRDAFPKGKKVNEATYKIGVCFQELGMKDDARTFYEELIAKAPASPEAKRAKIRLKKVK